MHRVIADRLESHPELVTRARARVQRWLDRGGVHRRYASLWRDILDRPVADIAATLVERTEQAADLRSVSPFAGALEARERWQILRRVSERPDVEP